MRNVTEGSESVSIVKSFTVLWKRPGSKGRMHERQARTDASLLIQKEEGAVVMEYCR